MWLRRVLIGLLLSTAAAGVAFLLSQLPRGWRNQRQNEETVLLPDLLGMVRNDHGSVAAARVRIKGTPTTAESDAGGRFRLPGSRGRVTAWKDGYLIAGADADSSPLELLLTKQPAEDCPSYTWVDPAPDKAQAGNCANCHEQIYTEWSASGHARSVNGKHFRNLYDGTDWNGKEGVSWSLRAEKPDGGGVCASCHAPAAEVAAKLPDIEGVAAHGVHCDYCHKISGVADGTLGVTHGRFNLELLRPVEGQLFFGPLDDVDRGEDAYAPLYKDSAYCASCHEGIVFGVHVYSTYSEWKESAAREEGKHCQTCHMKPTGKMTNIAPGKGGIERDPKTLANHRFFDASQAEMLRQCVKPTARLERGGEGVKVRIDLGVENVGHRVPTGFVDRHLLLVVEGLDAEGKSVPLRDGPKLPAAAGKALARQPGKLYAKLLQDEEGHAPAPFWSADAEPVDTRLTPGKPDSATFLFPGETRRIRVRLIYRRFWQEVAQAKKWPDGDMVIADQNLEVDP
jgi:hypothetical protein